MAAAVFLQIGAPHLLGGLLGSLVGNRLLPRIFGVTSVADALLVVRRKPADSEGVEGAVALSQAEGGATYLKEGGKWHRDSSLADCNAPIAASAFLTRPRSLAVLRPGTALDGPLNTHGSALVLLKEAADVVPPEGGARAAPVVLASIATAGYPQYQRITVRNASYKARIPVILRVVGRGAAGGEEEEEEEEVPEGSIVAPSGADDGLLPGGEAVLMLEGRVWSLVSVSNPNSAREVFAINQTGGSLQHTVFTGLASAVDLDSHLILAACDARNGGGDVIPSPVTTLSLARAGDDLQLGIILTQGETGTDSMHGAHGVILVALRGAYNARGVSGAPP